MYPANPTRLILINVIEETLDLEAGKKLCGLAIEDGGAVFVGVRRVAAVVGIWGEFFVGEFTV